MERVIACGLACVLLVASACDRNIEPFVEGEEAKAPDLAKMFPETDNGPSGEAISTMPGAVRSAVMPEPASEASITGRIEISGDLAGAAPSGATLFVIARRSGTAGGPPLAVLRIPNATLPLDFEIGPQNAMIQGMPFSGDIALTARLDSDGDAMTRANGDLAGAAKMPLQPGAAGVRLVLDERL